MRTITLTIDNEDVDYTVKENADLTVRDWFAVYDAYNLREYKEVEMADGRFEKEVVPKEEESEAFKFDKQVALCTSFCNIPAELYYEFVGLAESVLGFTPSLEYKKTVKAMIKLNGVDYFRTPMEMLSFQQWADVESYPKIDRIAPIAVVYKEREKKYDRLNKDLAGKIAALYDLNAEKFIFSLLSLYEEFNDVRESFYFVYNADYGKQIAKSPNMNKHYEAFGWQDTVISVAEAGLFGNLAETRDAKATEVLDYLNVKRSKDSAESRDYALNNKNT